MTTEFGNTGETLKMWGLIAFTALLVIAAIIYIGYVAGPLGAMLAAGFLIYQLG